MLPSNATVVPMPSDGSAKTTLLKPRMHAPQLTLAIAQIARPDVMFMRLWIIYPKVRWGLRGGFVGEHFRRRPNPRASPEESQGHQVEACRPAS